MLKSIISLVLVVLLLGCATPLTKPNSWTDAQVKTGGSLSVWNYTAGERQCRKINDWYYQYRMYRSSKRIDDVVFQYISPELKSLLPFYLDGFKTTFRGDFKSLPDNEKRALIQSIQVSCADYDIFKITIPNAFPAKSHDIPKVLSASRDLLNYDKKLVGIRGEMWKSYAGGRSGRYAVDEDRFVDELEERAKKIDEISAVLENALVIEKNTVGPNVSPLFRPDAGDKIRDDIGVIRRMWMEQVIGFYIAIESGQTVEEKVGRLKSIRRYWLRNYTKNLSSIYHEYGVQALNDRINKLTESIKSDYASYFKEGRRRSDYSWVKKYRWLINNIVFDEGSHPKNDPGVLKSRGYYLSQTDGFNYAISRMESKLDLVRFVKKMYVPEIDSQIAEWKLVEKRALTKLNELDADRGGSGTKYVKWPDEREVGVMYLEELYDVLVKMSQLQEIDDPRNFDRLAFYVFSRTIPNVRDTLGIELAAFKDRLRFEFPVPLDHPVFAKYGVTGKELPRFDVSGYHGRKLLSEIYLDLFAINNRNKMVLIAYSNNFAEQIREQCGEKAFSSALLYDLSFSALGRMLGGEISDFKNGWRSTFGTKLKNWTDVSENARDDAKRFLKQYGCESPVSNILFENYRSVIEQL